MQHRLVDTGCVGDFLHPRAVFALPREGVQSGFEDAFFRFGIGDFSHGTAG